MKILRYLLPLLLIVTLSGCGLFYGQFMRSSEGVQQIEVVSGELRNLRPGSRVLVVGPFAKTREAFYICRGEEAAAFAQNFADKGLFHSELSVMPGFDDPAKTTGGIKALRPEELTSRFNLAAPPELVLFGTILSREMTVAPGRGVIMSVGYRLEFYNPHNRQSTVLEVTVRDIFADCIPNIVDALLERLANR